MESGVISGKIAKTVFEEMVQTKRKASEIVREKGLTQISDEGELLQIYRGGLGANVTTVAEYRSGKEKSFTFLVGQVMKVSRGKAIRPGQSTAQDRLKSE